MNESVTPWTSMISSEKLIKKLLAFTKAKMVYRSWMNGGLPKGYLFTDVVQDAITIYLKEFMFDPDHQTSESELEKSLQKMIVNRLKVLSELKDNRLEIVDAVTIENAFPQEKKSSFDPESFEASVLDLLEDEPLLRTLFSDLYFNEATRSELIEQYNISASEYDNRARRLRRKIEPLLNHHNIYRHGKIREKIDTPPERAHLKLAS